MVSIDQFDFFEKRVLIRVDYNVPLNEGLEIEDDTRIKASIPSIDKVLDGGGSVVLMSHLGRPKNGYEKKFSLRPVQKHLAELLNRDVEFSEECVGEDVVLKTQQLLPGRILLLENLRFHQGETSGDVSFSEELSKLGDVYINESLVKKYRKYIIWLWLIFIGGLCVSVSLIWMIASGYFGSLPTFEELENPKSNLASEVYSADDQILGKYFIQNRSNVGYDELSHNLVNALVATEDIRFVDHSGVDLRGLMRVLVKTILFQQGSGGGSTITQQLAKNLFPRDRLSKLELVVRKIKEWVIAVKLERNYTKKEILSMYLNTVPFGSNSFGIKSATKTFYKAPVKPPDEGYDNSNIDVAHLDVCM